MTTLVDTPGGPGRAFALKPLGARAQGPRATTRHVQWGNNTPCTSAWKERASQRRQPPLTTLLSASAGGTKGKGSKARLTNQKVQHVKWRGQGKGKSEGDGSRRTYCAAAWCGPRGGEGNSGARARVRGSETGSQTSGAASRGQSFWTPSTPPCPPLPFRTRAHAHLVAQGTRGRKHYRR